MGVVARVSGLCCELNINIEDVTQSILQGMFAMIMLEMCIRDRLRHQQDALLPRLGPRPDALVQQGGLSAAGTA